MSGLGFGWFAGLAGSGGRLEVSIAGMDFGREALRSGDLLKQRCKLFYFGGLEAGAHELVVGAGEVADLGEGICAAGGEAKRVEAAVLGVGSAGDELARFERVDDGDEAAGVHAEGFGELLLTDARGLAKQAKDANVGGRELEGLEEPGELLGGARADLGEQESDSIFGRLLHDDYSCIK
jgi:hypothetical protein